MKNQQQIFLYGVFAHKQHLSSIINHIFFEKKRTFFKGDVKLFFLEQHHLHRLILFTFIFIN